MSKVGDELFTRLQRQLAGIEPANRPGRKCARCQKDMSDYVVFFEPKPTDVCNECRIELANEDHIARWKAAKPPIYDIDTILSTPHKHAYEIVGRLNSHIDPYCPEALLLPPELVVRDFDEFSCFEGHDLGYIIARNGGARIFLRGLRAINAISAARMAKFMAAVRAFALAHGVRFPDPLPDPWLCDIHIDREMEQRLDQESRRLSEEMKPYEGMVHGDLNRMLVRYLHDHADVLRQRKPK